MANPNVAIMQAPFNPEKYVPYQLLWIKVIFRAAYDFALWKNSPDLRLRKHAQDAAKWLFEPSSLEFSFESICYNFNLPLAKFREYARNLTPEDVKKLEFRERTGRDPLPGDIVTLALEEPDQDGNCE